MDQDAFKQKETQTVAARRCPKCGLDVSETQTVCPQDGTTLVESMVPGSVLDGKYVLLSIIGAGGMGVVYKARQIIIGKTVAIKTLHSHMLDGKTVARFQQEGKTAASLDHANIITVHDFAVSEHGQPYLVLDFVEGKTLSQMLKEQTAMPAEFVLRVVEQICDGLAVAHENGILHRDIKPSNIMIVGDDATTPVVKILDFGVAKILSSKENGTDRFALTLTGETMGSPLYMSPEQSLGNTLDARSDLYSVGCLMFECLTGSPPFIGETVMSTIMHHCNTAAPSLQEAALGRKFPPALEKLVAMLLDKDPNLRYQTARELKADIASLESGKEGYAERKAASDRAAVEARRKKISRLVLAVVAAVALLSGLLVWILRDSSGKPAVSPVPLTMHSSAVADMADVSYTNKDLRKLIMRNPNALKLDLRDWDLTDDDFLVLERCRKCTDFGCKNVPIKGSGLQYVKDMPLEFIDLCGTSINDDALKHLSGKERLRILWLSQVPISGSGLKYLGKCNALKEIHAGSTEFQSKNLSYLKQFANLRFLDLSASQVTDDGLQNLNSLTSLRALKLDANRITDNGIAKFSSALPLTFLGLNDTAITDKSVETIVKFANLHHLDLEDTALTDSGILKLGELKTLTGLNLKRCAKLTDPGIAALRAKLPPNCKLEVEGRKRFNDAKYAPGATPHKRSKERMPFNF